MGQAPSPSGVTSPRPVLRVAVVGLIAAGAWVAGGCSGKSEDGGAAGSGGSAMSGGTSGSSGATGKGSGGAGGAESGGSGGAPGGSSPGGSSAGGSSGEGGGGGPAGNGAGGAPGGSSAGGGASGSGGGGAGQAGEGGRAGGGAECETAEDCVLASDCCNCSAEPRGASVPECDLVCITDRCTGERIMPGEVECRFGRCVIDRSCDHNQALCSGAPASCPEGLVRALDESGCFGPCLPPTDCREVTSCDDCGSAACVEVQISIFVTGCVDPADGCQKGNYCECLGACSGFPCAEQENGVGCYCPNC